MHPSLKIEYLPHYDLYAWGPLVYAHEDDSGFDLRAAIADVAHIPPESQMVIPNGVKVEIPRCPIEYALFEIQIRPRSGLAAKHGISVTNSPGTIDSGYRGEIGTIVRNLGYKTFTVEPGDRISQGVMAVAYRPVLVSVDSVDIDTLRGAGGLGSTGVKVPR